MTKRLLKTAVLSGAGLLALGVAAVARAADEPHLVPSAQLNAMVATATGVLTTKPVPTGPGATVLMVRRNGDGEVEVHERLNDEFVVRSGHAVVRVGGTVAGNRQTAPGEWRGGTMTGGSFYHLGPGDVLWIPAGQPHQTLADKGQPFDYLAFKFEAKP